MGTRMLQRRGTAAEWTAANPVLGDGEIGYEKATGRIKIGDGATAWNSLPAVTLPLFLVDAAGDLLVGSADNTVVKLAKGSNGQVLTVDSGGNVAWVTPNPFSVVDVAGDLIVGSGSDTVTRLAKGNNGDYLSVVAGSVAWITPPATDLSSRIPYSLFDAAGDLLVGTANDAGGRLAKGANGTVLTVDGSGNVGWAAPAVPSATVTSQTTTYSVAAGVGVVFANGTFTVTLPTAVGASGRSITVKNTGTGTITVATSGGNIDGSSTAVITKQYASITAVSDGTNWFLI